MTNRVHEHRFDAAARPPPGLSAQFVGAKPIVGLTRGSRINVRSQRFIPWIRALPGNAIAGAYAVALGEGRSPVEALAFATNVGSRSNQQLGAQEAMPTLAAVNNRWGPPKPPLTPLHDSDALSCSKHNSSYRNCGG